MKPRAYDSRIVEGEHIARRKIIWQIEDATVLELRNRMWPNDKQPCRVAWFRRAQSDTLFWQFKIEEIDSHNAATASKTAMDPPSTQPTPAAGMLRRSADRGGNYSVRITDRFAALDLVDIF